jgi:capsular polysaccharide biosynthesis protein
MADPSEGALPPDVRGPEKAPLRAVVSYWPWALVVVVVFAVLAYAVSATRPERYRATASVFLSTPEESPIPAQGPIDPVRRARNEAAVMTSLDVANRVSQQLGGLTPADVLSAVEATPASETDIITLSAGADGADESLRLLNAVEAAYEASTRERAQAVYETALAQLQNDQRNLEAELNVALDTLASNPTDAAAARRRDSLSQEITNIQAQATELYRNRLNAESRVRFYDPSDPPTEKTSPQPLRNAVIGALLGVVVAALLLWWRASRSRYVEQPSVAEARLGLPLLGVVPAKRSGGAGGAATRPLDTYHWILATADRAIQERPSKLVVVTAARDTRASASVLLNLTEAVAETGRSVLLVDADARTAALTSVLDAGGAPGFSDVAARACPVADVGIPRNVDGATIRFVPVGTRSRDAGAISASRGAIDALSAFESAADAVYVHLPPLPSSPETAILAQRAAGVIVVVTPRTLLSSLDRLRATAEAFDLSMLGYVFDRSVRSRDWPRRAAERRGPVGPEPAATKADRLAREQDLAS